MRQVLEQVAVKLVCRLTGGFGGGRAIKGLYRSRILGGPLRRSFITLITPDRPSYVLGRFEPHVVAAIHDRLQQGGVAYDVGSHIGYLTMVMSKRVGPSGSVFAFEAYPRVVVALRANLSQRGYENSKVVERAISDSNETVRFATFEYSTIGHVERESTASDATVLDVQGSTLDHFVFDDGHPVPDFIKIDVNGAELQVLAGAERLFMERPPHVLVEVRSSTEAEVIEHMGARGFACTRLVNDRQAQADLFNLVFSPQR